jgi:DNA/RNA-binding domain of Phe-tRNA-synthetase-like protein
MNPDHAVNVAADLTAIVRPVTARTGEVRVSDLCPPLDEPLRLAAVAMRTRAEPADVIAAVRSMYRRFGVDPTKTRPSSEALLRRVRKGGELPRINSLVDIINWCSLESQLPFGLYDVGHVRGAVTVRLGRDCEEYAGIRKDTVHLAGRLTVADEDGPFGNPTSDSARTMVTPATTEALVVIFAPAALGPAVAADAMGLTIERVSRYCSH